MNNNEWITDRKPSEQDENWNGEVLASTRYRFLVIATWDEDDQTWIMNGRHIPEAEITAWMRLPDAYDERMEVEA